MAEHEVPDLHDVEEKIHAAHDAEDKLLHTMPNAIHPDDSAYPGMVPPSAPPATNEHNAEEQPEPDTEERDNDWAHGEAGEEAFVESAVVEDDSPPPGDPDHR